MQANLDSFFGGKGPKSKKKRERSEEEEIENIAPGFYHEILILKR